jgi:SAM-dependent methyltransferase
MADSDSDSSSDTSSEGEPDWEVLESQLGSDALVALRAHFQSKLTAKDERQQNNDSSERAADTIPANNATYSEQTYWNDRFAKEDAYEWLVGYTELASILDRLPLGKQSRILIVGCGNSSLTVDMHNAGYSNIVSTDYSEVVISAMRSKHDNLPGLSWEVMDMLNLTYPDSSFDVVLDKAAMDAIHTNEGSVWSPSDECIDATHRCTQLAHSVANINRELCYSNVVQVAL